MRMQKNILIDTCIWIDFFNKSDHPFKNILNTTVSENRAYTTGVVVSELIYGVKSDHEKTMIHSLFSGLHVAETDFNSFMNAGNMGYTLKRNGITVPLSDLVIASACIDYDCMILTTDKHFMSIAKFFPLEIPLQ